ncbi:hypothetical protein [Methylobacterium oxalidis]|uniref:Uncharacterized protein n=1 Tax=Methylobacterium oxalidis TaxID=944322 RepID=A0A512JA60_9HYPH|nr:hypothetical protein [Methylobacterium oxalidis]GEP06840.1 hypothetical protein MOX02_48780 [Methylobacterium oxalidis]GJE35025.1 hypothetical protein LDDCCGHA_5242 [Methylobacterium oxalidis]GLS67558.1 hypothetical protein GCM10007888_59420 [Methylobacterium oxalidis]
MARIRSIHPGIFTDEAFMTASPHARLLIMGLWCEAFDDGVFEWKPLTLKVRLMPADAIEVAPLLAELEGLNFVRRFQAKGKTYGLIRNFQKYQRPKKPNRSGVLPEELRSYVLGEGIGSDVVQEEFGTSGEPLPHGEEDGGGGGIGGKEGAASGAGAPSREAALAQAAPRRSGTDELGGLLRPLVGSLPVSVDPDLSPILALLREGLTEADVIAGVQACVERARRKPRCWGDFENWIRRAAKDRLEAAPRLPLPAAIRAPDPEKIRRGLFILACEHFRGRWSDGWSNATRPGHPDCTTPEEIIEEARLAVELERSVDLNRRQERHPAFAH